MKYVFVVDEENKSFSFAGMEFNKYKMLYTAKDVCALDGSNAPPIKATYDKFIEKYDITPKAFMKVHNGIMSRLWLDPVRKYSKYLAFQGVSKKPIKHLLKRVHETLPLLQQADEDGVRNIIPILFSLGASPKEAKGILGKSLWKKLCKNSFTKNNHIRKLLPCQRGLVIPTDYETLNKFPSTLLARGRNLRLDMGLGFDETALWVIENNKKSFGKYLVQELDNRYYCNMYNDTKRMAKKLGASFSDKWDFNKMESKHNEYTDLVNKGKYSTDRFPILTKTQVKTSFEYRGYEATLLDNPKDILNEGTIMKHCVGSYSDMVAEGKYLVYSITKDGKRSSTLGIHVNNNIVLNTNVKVVGGIATSEKPVYSYSQHYKPCNQRVICKDEQRLAVDLIKELNNE